MEQSDLDHLSYLDILFLTLVGEARGELIEGQVAVGNVIKNRCIHGKTIRDVCLAPLQFSCWNKKDPNRKILDEMAHKLTHGLSGDVMNDPHILQCKHVAEGLFGDLIKDNTKGSNHYMTHSLYYSEKRPKWAGVDKQTQSPLEIGNHIFLKL